MFFKKVAAKRTGSRVETTEESKTELGERTQVKNDNDRRWNRNRSDGYSISGNNNSRRRRVENGQW